MAHHYYDDYNYNGDGDYDSSSGSSYDSRSDGSYYDDEEGDNSGYYSQSTDGDYSQSVGSRSRDRDHYHHHGSHRHRQRNREGDYRDTDDLERRRRRQHRRNHSHSPGGSRRRRRRSSSRGEGSKSSYSDSEYETDDDDDYLDDDDDGGDPDDNATTAMDLVSPGDLNDLVALAIPLKDVCDAFLEDVAITSAEFVKSTVESMRDAIIKSRLAGTGNNNNNNNNNSSSTTTGNKKHAANGGGGFFSIFSRGVVPTNSPAPNNISHALAIQLQRDPIVMQQATATFVNRMMVRDMSPDALAMFSARISALFTSEGDTQATRIRRFMPALQYSAATSFSENNYMHIPYDIAFISPTSIQSQQQQQQQHQHQYGQSQSLSTLEYVLRDEDLQAHDQRHTAAGSRRQLHTTYYQQAPQVLRFESFIWDVIKTFISNTLIDSRSLSQQQQQQQQPSNANANANANTNNIIKTIILEDGNHERLIRAMKTAASDKLTNYGSRLTVEAPLWRSEITDASRVATTRFLGVATQRALEASDAKEAMLADSISRNISHLNHRLSRMKRSIHGNRSQIRHALKKEGNRQLSMTKQVLAKESKRRMRFERDLKRSDVVAAAVLAEEDERRKKKRDRRKRREEKEVERKKRKASDQRQRRRKHSSSTRRGDDSKRRRQKDDRKRKDKKGRHSRRRSSSSSSYSSSSLLSSSSS